MVKFDYCKPISAKAIPSGPDWIHEVKYDGYRGRIVRDGKNVKLLSRSGLDWTWRFPWIVETALKIRHSQFIIDGEICVLDVQGISDFDARIRTSTTTRHSSMPSIWWRSAART
jgi:bifunctional non-homologous end joining protein LigD